VAGGANNLGTVFSLKLGASGWQEQVLYSFDATFPDITGPAANVVLDNQGNLYGCGFGGVYGTGGLFRLTPPSVSGGAWTSTVILSFGNKKTDPRMPADYNGCGITIDPATGSLFGTTPVGGEFNHGTVFEVDPPAAGQTQWTGKLIHTFTGNPRDSGGPVAAPLKVGNTYFGSTGDALYEFTP
jgi:uncharacterized repeat protein (TIGR03803 family)